MPSPGEIVDHYEILEPLGHGGMGEVFLAHDKVLDRKVALKFLPEKMEKDETARQRFLREAKAVASLDHPFICDIHEIGDTGGRTYIVMEFVEGETLEDVLEKEPLPVKEAIRLGSEIAEALEVAHAKGIIHRDLKPSNIMLTSQGHAKVMDFGLAKRVPPSQGNLSQEKTLSGSLTATGAIPGTLYYMSPEQAKSEAIDARSDIFSFGVLFHEMVTGKNPFRRPSVTETVSAILRDPAPPVHLDGRRPSNQLDAILAKAMAKDPAGRYSSMKDLATDLRALGESLDRSARRAHIVMSAVAALAIVASIALGVVWFPPGQEPAAPTAIPEPMAVLVADFQNRTGDSVFEGVLEQAMVIALEGAPFISSYKRGRARGVLEQIQAGAESLDEEMARLVGRREGIQVVISGSIDVDDDVYGLTVRAIDAIDGKVISTFDIEAAGKEEVLSAVGKLAIRTRNALGDTASESPAREAETFTAASLDAARHYAAAQDHQAAGRWPDAIASYRHAIQLDPDFGRAYAGLAATQVNMGQVEEAARNYEQAMARIDRMTSREKHRTLGGYYLMARNFQKAIEEFETLVEQYPADETGLSNLALAHFYGRNMTRALTEGRRAVETYPNNVVMRANLALYAMYAGDFETALKQAGVVLESNPAYAPMHVCKALSELGLGRVAESVETYRRLKGLSSWGASLAMTGLADLAAYEGRWDDASSLFENGISGDLATRNDAAAARNISALAGTQIARERMGAAVVMAEQAVSRSSEPRVLYEAAQVYVAAGRRTEALELASELGSLLQEEPQAYARMIEGEVQLGRGNFEEAVRLFRQAQERVDTWLGRLHLGRAYLEAGAFTEAYSEFDKCLKRRGESTAVFLDDLPSARYFPQVYYYLGRAQEGLGSPAAAESYRAFLKIRAAGDGDPLVADASRRLGSS